MAGFLDKNDRIVDMVLTMEGKRLLARGELRFSYFALFDDEVDYDPFVSQSGSMTLEQLSGTRADLIENTLVREAVTGYRMSNASGSDFTNVRRPLFTMRQGSKYLPRLTGSDAPTGSLILITRQQKVQENFVRFDQNGQVVEQIGPVDRGFVRFDPQHTSVGYSLQPADAALDPNHQEGILVRVFRSGTEGLVEVTQRQDAQNDIVFGNDLVISVGIDRGS